MRSVAMKKNIIREAGPAARPRMQVKELRRIGHEMRSTTVREGRRNTSGKAIRMQSHFLRIDWPKHKPHGIITARHIKQLIKNKNQESMHQKSKMSIGYHIAEVRICKAVLACKKTPYGTSLMEWAISQKHNQKKKNHNAEPPLGARYARRKRHP